MGFTRLSGHGLQRLTERSTLQPGVLCQTLDMGLGVHIGYNEGGNLGYQLFYSRPDDAAYVAVQDVNNGSVLTVMPINFHGVGIHMEIKPADVEEARRRVQQLPKRPGEVWLKVRARYIDDDCQFATKTVMYLDGAAYGNDPQQLRDSFGFDMNVRLRAMEKGVDPFRIVEASIQRWPLGEPVFYDLALMTPTQRLMLGLRQKQTAEDYLMEQMSFDPTHSSQEKDGSEDGIQSVPGRAWVG